jgi:hypothetical protein
MCGMLSLKGESYGSRNDCLRVDVDGTSVWVICFWWMRRISARQDALFMELKELAKTQHDILKEVHPDVGEIKEHVIEEQGEKIEEIAEQVSHVEEAVTSPEASKAADNGRR